jgi:hypothetical protein
LAVLAAITILVPTTLATGEAGTTLYARLGQNRFPGGFAIVDAKLHFVNQRDIRFDVQIVGGVGHTFAPRVYAHGTCANPGGTGGKWVINRETNAGPSGPFLSLQPNSNQEIVVNQLDVDRVRAELAHNPNTTFALLIATVVNGQNYRTCTSFGPTPPGPITSTTSTTSSSTSTTSTTTTNTSNITNTTTNQVACVTTRTIPGTITTINGATTTVGGTVTTIGGQTVTVTGTATTIPGSTVTVAGTGTTILGTTNTATTIGDVTTTVGGTTSTIQPVTTTIGGTTQTITGTATTVGGTTVTLPASTSTSFGQITTATGTRTTISGTTSCVFP